MLNDTLNDRLIISLTQVANRIKGKIHEFYLRYKTPYFRNVHNYVLPWFEYVFETNRQKIDEKLLNYVSKILIFNMN